MKFLCAIVVAALLSVGSLTAQDGAWTALQPYDLALDPTDVPVPGDYTGDGKADIAIAHVDPDGLLQWLRRCGPQGTCVQGVQWGIAGDLLVPGDYDGDHKVDVAVVRHDPSQGSVWYIRLSSANDGTSLAIQWGIVTDRPVAADYDGDGRMDIAIFRPSTGVFWVLKSSCGFTCGVALGPVVS